MTIFLDQQTHIRGHLREDGRVFNNRFECVGYIALDGRVYRPDGLLAGYTSLRGRIYDANARPLGHVNSAGEVYAEDGTYVGRWSTPVERRLGAGGAVLLLFLFVRQ
jgi:hypothetical protein